MKFPFNGKEWYIDKGLAYQLCNLVMNVKSDWDFVIFLTGDRQVRIGKSVLAQRICAFLCHLMNLMDIKTEYTLDSIYFDVKKLREDIINKPKHSIIHFDEARKGFAASKWSSTAQQELLDFFSECGQMNHVIVMVAPDFFEMKEEMAVGRSEYLINVYRKSTPHFSKNAKLMRVFGDVDGVPQVKLSRGYFEFFNRQRKAFLFDKVKRTREKNYQLVKSNLKGRFTDGYVIDEVSYKEKKMLALKSFEKNKEVKKTELEKENERTRDKIIIKERKKGKKYREISQILKYEWDIDLGGHQIGAICRKNGVVSDSGDD